MFQQSEKGASTIKTMIMVAVLCVVFVLSMSFGAAAFGFRMEGESVPQYSDTAGGQLTDGCDIPENYLAVFNDAVEGFTVSPALIASIFYAGEHYDKNKKSAYWPDNINGPWGDGPSTKQGTAKGPFQFKDGTWAQYGMGGNVQEIKDAARGAANMFEKNIAKGKGDEEHKIKNAIENYNTDPEYVERVYKQYIEFLNKCYTKAGQKYDNADEFFLQDRQNEQEWRKAVMSGEGQSGRPLIDGIMTPTAIVLHWTAGPTKQGAMGAMKNSKNAVHLIVDTDGKVYQLLPLNAKTRSGSHVASQFSIAIEIVSTTALKSDDPNQYKIHEDMLMSNERTAQRDAVVNTINHLSSAYGIRKMKGTYIKNKELEELDIMEEMGIFGHYQTGPKEDPGESFMNEIWSRVGAE